MSEHDCLGYLLNKYSLDLAEIRGKSQLIKAEVLLNKNQRVLYSLCIFTVIIFLGSSHSEIIAGEVIF